MEFISPPPAHRCSWYKALGIQLTEFFLYINILRVPKLIFTEFIRSRTWRLLQRKFHLCTPRIAWSRDLVPMSTFMCMWAIYIFPGSVHIFSCSRIGRPIVGIFKSLTDTWMWKLGLRPCNSFSGNTYIEFSVLCLCSVRTLRTGLVGEKGPCNVRHQGPLALDRGVQTLDG
jgi:hypothetical protein